MSRIFVSAFLIITMNAVAQDFRSEHIAYADQWFKEQDYPAAIRYYEYALNLDSSDLEVRWKYAESLRLYRDYREAEKQYRLIYEEEKTSRFLRSLYYLAEMCKHNANYDQAIDYFKEARKKYSSDKQGYLYNKCKQEIESCLWARKAIKDTADLNPHFLAAPLNTPDSEFPHSIHNHALWYSSLKPDSIPVQGESYQKEQLSQLYQYHNGSEVKRIELKPTGKKHQANGTFSIDGKRFYYSGCRDYDHAFQCKIVVAQVENGALRNPDTLGTIINEEDANTTMPRIALFEGKETLFFASDRSGGKGGLDIYYSFIQDGSQYSKPQAIKLINSIDHDITPFYDSDSNRLYFASSWLYGFGGYDLFSSDYRDRKFSEPVNLGLPVNSPANDFYPIREKDSMLFGTNRIGVQYRVNPTCCSDIMAYHIPQAEPITQAQISDSTIVNIKESRFKRLEDLKRKMPITLYFHNDIPDPRSVKPTTNVNYRDSYDDYMAMIPQYKKEYAKGLTGDKANEAEIDIEDFFKEYVEQGMKDLKEFEELLLQELEKGSSLVLTVKGFASPLARTDYNVNLTKRRIASLVNYLSSHPSGKYKAYLEGSAPNGAKLQIQEVPFGEYQAASLTSDNPNDLKNSVYSRAAAIERKIEIQSVTFLKRDSIHYLVAEKQLQDLGAITPDQTVSRNFIVKNNGSEPIEIERIEIPCDCNTATMSKQALAPGETATVTISFNPKGYEGKQVKSVYLHVKNALDPLRLVLTSEVKP